ncbi:MAG: Na(+)/H(+) antiporter subunit B [Candidatus Methylomirabilales bacterium]
MQVIAGILYLALGLGAIACAHRAMSAQRILSATLYLASVSALVALTLYLLGAIQVAVIELSVGAGLVTVLLVWAISLTGNDTLDARPILPRPLAAAATLLAAALLLWMAVSVPGHDVAEVAPSLDEALWGERILDVWIQMVLIFAGVLGVLGLLAETERPARHAESPAAVEAGGVRTPALQPFQGYAAAKEVR